MMEQFVFSDIHGNSKLFWQIYDWLNARPEYWRCYFLGDANDRGPDGYEIMKILLRDHRFVYIKGNHEDMFCKAARVLKSYKTVGADLWEIYQGYDEDVDICLRNDGIFTLNDWIKDGMPMSIIKELEQLPEHIEIVNDSGLTIDLSHAGHMIDESDDFIWSRKHFLEKWDKGLMIHGHTPIHYLRRLVDVSTKSMEPAFYKDGTKLDLDTACFSSGIINVVDLNTLKHTKFVSWLD